MNIEVEKIRKRFFELQDLKYAAFQAKLTPTLEAERFIGVRMPALKKLAKEYNKEEAHHDFMQQLPHYYYEENMLHAQLIALNKDYEECIEQLKCFLPYVDNWAVSDTMVPKMFRKHLDEVLIRIREWVKSDHVYTCRFGVDMLMSFYLDEEFQEEYLEIPAAVHSEEYYVNMMIAWYYATALAKQWEPTIKYLEEERLDRWVHNKTIQKAVESYRITDEQKAYLRTLRRK